MTTLSALLDTVFNLLTIIVGFGLIIVVHELGHFLAARWAGIRVLAFAVGFGPPVLSYRRGLGWRRGSSDAEYARLVAAPETAGAGDSPLANRLSPTEYRLGALPLGGYVKMLGQEDLDPAAVSDAADSYQNAPVWKRMIVISAGVIANVVSAAALFIVVFMIGLRTEPAKVGSVEPGSPAETARLVGGEVVGDGLRPGDAIRSINGEVTRSFNDVFMAVGLAESGRALRVVVDRPGMPGPLTFEATPEESAATGLLSLGVGSPVTATLVDAPNLTAALASFGVEGVEPGSRVVEAGGTPVRTFADIEAVFAASKGEAVTVLFESPGGTRSARTLRPDAEAQVGSVPGSDGTDIAVQHLLGMLPVMTVARQGDEPQQGLARGDVIARIGEVEYPSLADGIRAIRARKGMSVDVEVLRTDASGGVSRVALRPRVRPRGEGTIGFTAGTTWADSALVAAPPTRLRDAAGGEPTTPRSAGVIPAAGSRVVAVEGAPTATLVDVRERLREAVDRAGGACVARLTFELPVLGHDGSPVTQERTLTIDEHDAEALRSLSWTCPIPAGLFEPEQGLLRASSPAEAVAIGLHETRRIAASVYVQFARLFQGSVRIEHVKGPVGIAHIGTLVASRGAVWVLFFMAMISVNLAVINFLPLPIVDGGQFLMLCYEQARGRPVPIGVQNAVTMAGLALIASVFVVVTFNDVRTLLGL